MKLKKSDLQKIIREELKNLHEAEAVDKDNYTVEELPNGLVRILDRGTKMTSLYRPSRNPQGDALAHVHHSGLELDKKIAAQLLQHLVPGPSRVRPGYPSWVDPAHKALPTFSSEDISKIIASLYHGGKLVIKDVSHGEGDVYSAIDGMIGILKGVQTSEDIGSGDMEILKQNLGGVHPKLDDILGL